MSALPPVVGVANPPEDYVSPAILGLANPPEDYVSPAKASQWPPKEGYPKELFVDSSVGEEYSCAVCGKVPRDPVEMTCDGHSRDDSSSEDEKTSQKEVMFCEHCLLHLLQSNGNKCPISHHPSPEFQKIIHLRKALGKKEVKCPHSLGAAQGSVFVCPIEGTFHPKPMAIKQT